MDYYRNMALNERQFEALKAQLEKKKASLGDAEYSTFLQKAAAASTPEVPEDDNGFVMDVGQGVAKSAGELALGVGTLGRNIQKGLSKGADLIFGSKNFGLGGQGIFDPGSEARQPIEETLARDTAGEKVGGFVGDVASFALPGGAVVKGTKGANFLTRAAALGASDAAITTARQGEFDRGSVDAAIIGAVFPIVGKGASAAKQAILPSGADAGGKVINSLIKPLLKDFSYGKNPGKAVAEAGITASSLDDLATKIKVARQETGEQISNAVAKSNKTFNATDALIPLDEALEVAKKSPRTNATVINRLQNLKDDLLQVDADGVAQRQLDNLTADEFWKFNQDIGELARWTGNATDDEIVNKALKRTYSSTRKQLEQGVGGVDELSEKYANLKSAEVATEYRDKIAARQNLLSFSGTQAGLGSGLLTAAATGGVTTPLLVGAGAAAITEASKTPAFKTQLAAWLAGSSKKALKEAFTEAPWLRGTLQTILLGED